MQPRHRRSLTAFLLCLLCLPAYGRAAPPSAAYHALQTTPTPGQPYWDTQFIPPGVDGGIYAIAISGNDVYVGGRFETAGGVAARNLARWDGARWHAVGQTASSRPELNTIYDLTVISGTLHIATFWSSGGSGYPMPSVVTWDGQRWNELTGQPSHRLWGGIISDLQLYDGQLYAAGTFELEGTPERDGGNIARWDGSAWRSVGGGLISDPMTRSTSHGWTTVDALTVHQGALIAGGSFTTAAGAPADLIARWDGSAWSEVGDVRPAPNQNQRINALTTGGGKLYAGGRFTSFSGAPASNIAAWDGTSWQLPGQSDPEAPTQVTALALRGGRLYAGNEISVATEFGLKVWDGAMWRKEPGFADRRIWTMAQNAGALYLGGYFKLSSMPDWRGTQVDIGSALQLREGGWHGLGNGLPLSSGGGTGAIAAFNKVIYVRTYDGLMAWDRQRWTRIAPLGGTMLSGPGPVAGSEGVHILGSSAAGRQVWRWNGREWAALGGVFNDDLTALAADGATLYAAGRFTSVGGAPANGLARWDGSRWQGISSGLGAGDRATWIAVLTAHNGMLYAGGDFSSIDGVAATDIARWDGQRWAAFPAPPAESPVRGIDSIVAHGSDVYFLGAETMLLHWDGSRWLTNTPATPNSPAGTIYASGSLMALYDGQPVLARGISGMRRWTGTAWEPLGAVGGNYGSAAGMVQDGNDLFLAGSFLYFESGSDYGHAHHFARWNPVRLSTYLPLAWR